MGGGGMCTMFCSDPAVPEDRRTGLSRLYSGKGTGEAKGTELWRLCPHLQPLLMQLPNATVWGLNVDHLIS